MALAEVIRYDPVPGVLAWKYPNIALGTWSQLIVGETQEAVLVCNGRVADLFGPGHHTLTTDHIPILQRLVNLPFGGRSPFSAEVWFVSKTDCLDIKWGTGTPMQVRDPQYGIFVPVRAFGSCGVRITDSRRFLMKLASAAAVFHKDTLAAWFRGHFAARVKETTAAFLAGKGISALELNTHLKELSRAACEQLEEDFAEYGLEIVSFIVSDISVPEEDASVVQLKAALAKRAEREILGGQTGGNMVCPVCGAARVSRQKYCGACGTKLEGAENEE